MIELDTVISIHNLLIDKFGGSKEVRDLNILKAALSRPLVTFDQKELYPTPIDKASAIFESIIIGHPFIDGNKRIAYVLMRLVLMQYGLDIKGTIQNKYEFVISASKGEIRIDEIRKWIADHIVNIND